MPNTNFNMGVGSRDMALSKIIGLVHYIISDSAVFLPEKFRPSLEQIKPSFYCSGRTVLVAKSSIFSFTNKQSNEQN